MSDFSAARGHTTTGLAPNTAGAVAYVLGPVSGLLLLVLEKQNRFVRFHAAQAVTTGVLVVGIAIVLSMITSVLAFIPILGWLVSLLVSLVIGLGSFMLWLALMWRAFNGDEWEVPIAGPFARRMLAGTTPAP